jgi:hypothetical protein
MFDKANEAAATGDGRPKPEDLKEHLLIVRVIAHADDNPMGIKRKVGVNEDGTDQEAPADCIIADVVDLDGVDQPAYYDYIFLQAKLIAHFKTNVGNTLIGTLGKLPDQGQRKGAYFFTDQAHLPRIVAVGEAWAANNPDFFGPQAPGRATRQTRAERTEAVAHGQHEPAQPGQAANVRKVASTLEAMRATGNGGFDDEKAPF